MSRNEITKFIAQVNEEQSGQFQRVYEASFEGVSSNVNQNVEQIIKQQKGCRRMLMAFVDSEPSTDFKKSIQMDWMLKPVKYFDEE